MRAGLTKATYNSRLYLSIIAAQSAGFSCSSLVKALITVWYVGLYPISVKEIVSRSPVCHSRRAFCVYVAASVIEATTGS
jgi:hypothetical protein